MLEEYQQLKNEQAEALSILKADVMGRELFKEYKQLYPSIRGQLGMEEAYSPDVVVAVSVANNELLRKNLSSANKRLAMRPTPSASPSNITTESPEIKQMDRQRDHGCGRRKGH